MKDMYQDLIEIVKKDPGTLGDHLGKLLEEGGEFAKAVNRISGRKLAKPEWTEERIRENIVEEAIDTFQVVFSILIKLGFTYDEILNAFPGKNHDYETYLEKQYGN